MANFVVVAGSPKPASFEAIRSKAVSVYSSRMSDKSIESKRSCIEDAILLKADANYNGDLFWSDFAKRADKLTDSKFFCKKCEDAHLDPQNAAEHIVMMNPLTKINKLITDRDYESKDSIFRPFPEWQHPIIVKKIEKKEDTSVDA